ncbi:MAG: hypothetical protein DCC59_12690 [Chloroflexi bacterium]|nr:hypothetical protein [Chloroflexi bacterium CFX1]MCQ3951838.1 hypothetical protein [Chloroflexota bacterium]MDL1917798.1 hypothetical protein [Chloroflexi bacterium CFX5]RIK50771.1 MAG: hypothetical protein DCC59_12690 [Chloroflexota bacterium]
MRAPMKKNAITHRILCYIIAAFLLPAGCAPKVEPGGADSTESAAPVATAEATVQTTSATVVNRDLLLDPARTEDADSLLVGGYLYEGLVNTDDNGDIQPGIAFAWIVSDDELDYIFEIRQDARFSDGSPITVDAIAENFNRWFEPKHPLHEDGNFPAWKKYFLGFNGERDANNRAVSQIDGVQKVDVNTFIVHLNRPEAQLLNYLAEPSFAILSPAALADNPDYGARQSAIVSSGQYVVTSWTDEGMTLSPNPLYWGSAGDGDLNFIWR